MSDRNLHAATFAFGVAVLIALVALLSGCEKRRSRVEIVQEPVSALCFAVLRSPGGETVQFIGPLDCPKAAAP